MNLPPSQFSGPLFVPEAIEDLELLTEILDVKGESLSIVFAVASHVQSLPEGKRRLAPAVLERLDRSLGRLAGTTPPLGEQAR